MPCPTCVDYPNDHETNDGHDCDQPTGPVVALRPVTITAEQAGVDVRKVERLFRLADGVSALYLLLCLADTVLLMLYLSARIHYWQFPTAAALATDNGRHDLLQNLQPVLTVAFWAFVLTRMFAAKRVMLRRQGVDLNLQVGKHWSAYLEIGAYLVVILCGFFGPRLAPLNGMDSATAVAALQHYRQGALLASGLRIMAIAALLIGTRVRRGRVLAVLNGAVLNGAAPTALGR